MSTRVRACSSPRRGAVSGSCTPRPPRSTVMPRPIRRARARWRARSPPTASPSCASSTLPTRTPVRRGSRPSASATSPCTARVSGRTWHSRRCSRRSTPERPSGSSGTGRRRGASPTSPMQLRRRSRRWSVDGTGRSITSAAGRRRSMADAIALAERIAGSELRLERHGPAAGDVRRTRADVSKAAAELDWRPRLLADGAPRTVGVGRC